MTGKMNKTFALLGASKTGIALAYYLEKAGLEPAFLWNRSLKGIQLARKYIQFRKESADLSQIPADVEWIIIAVKDDAIEEVVQQLLGVL